MHDLVKELPEECQEKVKEITLLREEIRKEAESAAEEKDTLIKSQEDDYVTNKMGEIELETFLKKKLNYDVQGELKNLKESKRLHQVEHDELSKKIEVVENDLDDQTAVRDDIVIAEEEVITGAILKKPR